MDVKVFYHGPCNPTRELEHVCTDYNYYASREKWNKKTSKEKKNPSPQHISSPIPLIVQLVGANTADLQTAWSVLKT